MEAVDKLRARVQGFTKSRFVTYVRFPVLVARAVVGGKVERGTRHSGITRALGQPTHMHTEEPPVETHTPPDEELLVTHPLARQLWVEVKKSGHTPAEQAVTLGRSQELCDVVLNDYTVSKIHAAFGGDTLAGEFMIMDLGSTNGTVVDGRRLEPREGVNVYSGQTLQLGRLVFEVLTPEEFFEDLAGVRPKPKAFDLSLAS